MWCLFDVEVEEKRTEDECTFKKGKILMNMAFMSYIPGPRQVQIGFPRHIYSIVFMKFIIVSFLLTETSNTFPRLTQGQSCTLVRTPSESLLSFYLPEPRHETETAN